MVGSALPRSDGVSFFEATESRMADLSSRAFFDRILIKESPSEIQSLFDSSSFLFEHDKKIVDTKRKVIIKRNILIAILFFNQ